MKTLYAVYHNENVPVLVDDDFMLPEDVTLRIHTGYAYYHKHDKVHFLHRLITNAQKGEIVDHINGTRLDNRKENLRIVTKQQNNWNSRGKGYDWRKREQKWRAQIKVDGKKKHIGYFDNEEEARRAYTKAHVEYFGEYSPYYKELTGK